MGLWKIVQTPNGPKVVIDVKELKIRLQSLVREGNIEIVRLAIQSMLDELNDR